MATIEAKKTMAKNLPKKPNKEHVIRFRVSDKQLEILIKRAAKENLNISSYIRKLCTGMM